MAHEFRRSPPMSAGSWQRYRAAPPSASCWTPPSPAELAVLRLLDNDLSVRQIGEELFLSANTVRTHKRSLYRKLSVNTRADAVARADVLGLIGDRIHPCESGDSPGDGGRGRATVAG
jgi:DNA-binding NarL/FixJ family response regulator